MVGIISREKTFHGASSEELERPTNVLKVEVLFFLQIIRACLYDGI